MFRSFISCPVFLSNLLITLEKPVLTSITDIQIIHLQSNIFIRSIITFEKTSINQYYWSLSTSLTHLASFLKSFILITPFEKSFTPLWITNKSDFFLTTSLMQPNIPFFANPGCAAISTSLFFYDKFSCLKCFMIESRIIITFFFWEILFKLESKLGIRFMF